MESNFSSLLSGKGRVASAMTVVIETAVVEWRIRRRLALRAAGFISRRVICVQGDGGVVRALEGK